MTSFILQENEEASSKLLQDTQSGSESAVVDSIIQTPLLAEKEAPFQNM
jgi:hypothetical protein